ncbi:MAG: flagellar hook-associated protein FlgK [Candidatus Desulfofervidaceae bacterium]|nr:flagellar hook-associated protein FlgK [Candidatus Desulfofervidaceae bacterium]
MHGIYGLIDIAISSLKTAQTALMTTGDNISNAENPKFTRRGVVFQERPPIVSLPILIGRGAEVVKIKRAYDPFLAKQWQNELGNLGYYEVKKQALGRLENIFNEVQGGGLSGALDAFWNAWEDVAADPTSMVNRYNLVNKTKTLAATFQKMSTDIKELQNDTDTEIKGVVDKINIITQQIAYLNEKIRGIEIKGVDANNFRDERDDLVRQLAELADVTAFEDNGQITVLIGGVPVVEANRAFALSVETNADGFYNILWNSGDNVSVDITQRITKGKIAGYLEIRDEILPRYLDELDKLAYNLVNEINNQHQVGFGLDDSTGNDFFEPLTAVSDAAQQISLNSVIENSPDKIAAASAAGEPGNNENALAIIALKNTGISALGNANFSDFYQSLVGLVGGEAQESNLNLEHQESMLKDIKDNFDSVSGVSMDEEAANLIKFQQMYTASAKLISIADEMMKTLINLGA